LRKASLGQGETKGGDYGQSHAINLRAPTGRTSSSPTTPPGKIEKGHFGTGLSERGMRETIERLKPFFTEKPPVENPPRIPEKIQWVKPVFVCEVAFAEWTLDGELRQTTFLGWRDDKSPEEVVIENNFIASWKPNDHRSEQPKDAEKEKHEI
jgi:bifunctional non-homologous end joining protein LigD